MRLKKIDYTEFEGQEREWSVGGLDLATVNLIVGRNATGKTRTLNLTAGLAKLLSGERQPKFPTGNWVVEFEDPNIRYVLKIDDSRVIEESVARDGEVLLERGAEGIGKIFAAGLGEMLEVQIPQSVIAAYARRDEKQHPFLEPLFNWARAVHYYSFGTSMGRDHLAVLVKQAPDADPRDANMVVAIFRRGVREFGDDFKRRVLDDMAQVDYMLDDIADQSPSTVSLPAHVELPGPVACLAVRESGLQGWTEQLHISQGMFRVLAIIILLAYVEESSKSKNGPGTILIDDIGEGIDYGRSCKLVKLLMERAQASGIQLIMSTNDRFIMNAVPLQVWSVLQRDRGQCKVYNYSNSREIFDNFRFTGLSNFDFLAVDFIHSGTEIQ
jgi:energy-coupling factor transporter ATP-binding protein EcfA2